MRFSDACSLGRPRSAAQLNVGNRRASKGATERYEGFAARALKRTPSAIGQKRRWRDAPTECLMTKRARILLAETTVNIMVRNLLCLLDVGILRAHWEYDRKLDHEAERRVWFLFECERRGARCCKRDASVTSARL